MDQSVFKIGTQNNNCWFLKIINYRVIRYEDIACHRDGLKDVFDFVGFNNININSTLQTCSNPKEQEWIFELSLKEIISIQNSVSIYVCRYHNNNTSLKKFTSFQHNCLHVMKVFGYRPITEPEQIGKMNPVTPHLPSYNFDYTI